HRPCARRSPRTRTGACRRTSRRRDHRLRRPASPMDLLLTAEQQGLATAAEQAFRRDEPAPPTSGTLTDLVVVARELGRVAARSRFHTDVPASFLGWTGARPSAV